MLVGDHRAAKPGYIALILVSALLLVVCFVFNGLSAIGGDNSIFRSNQANLSDKYNLDLTPAGWTFSIWGFVYAGQALLITYCLTLLCRTNRSGGKLYCDPPFLPLGFFVTYSMTSILNVTWLFAFDSEFLAASFVALFGIFFTLLVCCFYSFKYLWEYEEDLTRLEMWLNIILVQNCLGLYVAWCAVATILNFSILLRYQLDIAMDTTCYVSLVILLAEILLFFFTDVLVATTRLRYFVTPYMVLIVAFSGVVDNNWDAGSGVAIFELVLLCVACILFVCKIIAMVYYSRKKPISIEM